MRSTFSLLQSQRNLILLLSKYKKFVQNTNMLGFFIFIFFTLKLFTLNFQAVWLTREFHLYCWDHVWKVNE